MKKFQFLYPAIFVRDEDDSYQVFFPDLNIYTDGKNSCEAYMYAKGLLEVYFSYALKYEIEYKKPTDLEKFLPQCKDNELVMFVDAIVETKE